MIFELEMQLGKSLDVDSGFENLDSTEADVAAEDVIWKSGQRVCTLGLVSRPELNGKFGALKDFDLAALRW